MKYVPVLLVIFSGCPHILCCKRWWKSSEQQERADFSDSSGAIEADGGSGDDAGRSGL